VGQFAKEFNYGNPGLKNSGFGGREEGERESGLIIFAVKTGGRLLMVISFPSPRAPSC
jgi:hypothetical protein